MQDRPIDHLRSSQTHESCVIICAHFGDGVTPEQAYRMKDALNSMDTDGWWFLNPDNFIVAFRSSKAGAERANACLSSLGRLTTSVASLARMAVGAAQGEVLCISRVPAILIRLH
jgi:hypothetical protein